MRVIDLFREWDEDGDGTVSKKEFRKAVPMLGLDPDYASPAGSDAWCPPLLRRWVRAADAFKQSGGRGRGAARQEDDIGARVAA